MIVSSYPASIGASSVVRELCIVLTGDDGTFTNKGNKKGVVE
jgi:hypothetical protein